MSKRSIEDRTERQAVGTRIAGARRGLGWSQERLAEALGVDPLTVSRLETGRRALTAGLALQVADALAVSVGQLLGRSPPGEDLVDEIAALLATMSPARRRTALAVVRELAREGHSPGDDSGP